MTNQELYRTPNYLANMLGPENTIGLIENIKNKLNNIISKKKQSQKNKLTKLINKYNKFNTNNNTECKHEFFPKLLNKTDILFEDKRLTF